MSQAEKIESGLETLRIKLEADLMTLYYENQKPDNEQTERWIRLYGAKFAKIVAERPDIVALYSSDKTGSIDQISELIYEKGV